MLYILSAIGGATLAFVIFAIFSINKGADDAPAAQPPSEVVKKCSTCAHKACELTASPCVDCIDYIDTPDDCIRVYTKWEAEK